MPNKVTCAITKRNKGICCLFVYGTLMSKAVGTMGKAQRDRLQREGCSLGAATMHGAQLYDLGRYPGLVESGDLGHIVHGELIALANPHITLRWLDEYEGFVPGDHDQNEYARRERQVRNADGSELTAFVYICLRVAEHHRLIVRGRYMSALTRQRQN